MVAEGNADAYAGIDVLMGPGKEGPPPETIVRPPKNLGADVRDVMDDKLGGPIIPELFDVR
jgi:hypothetical protein